MRLRGSLSFAVALGTSACFSDAPPIAGGTTTGAAECAIGSEGCFCTDGGGCDAGLECLLPAGACVAEGCTPGAGLCECADDVCVDGYECVENFCAPMGTDSDSMGSATMPTSSMITGPSTSDASDTQTTVDTTAAAEATSDPTAGSTGSTGEPETCAECLEQARSGACSDEWAACTTCDTMFGCFVGKQDDCCPGKGLPVSFDWQSFAACADMHCMALCGTLVCVQEV